MALPPRDHDLLPRNMQFVPKNFRRAAAKSPETLIFCRLVTILVDRPIIYPTDQIVKISLRYLDKILRALWKLLK